MKVPLLNLRAQHESIRDEIVPAVLDVIERQQFIMGPPVEAFEQAFADVCGVEHAVSCASGTDALLLALKALDLAPGDEVITTPFTFFASAGAVVNAGGRPVFVDIDPDTFNISPDGIREAITPRTRAIVPVHLFGQMAAMAEIRSIAEEGGIVVIEDAAQAVGARQCIGQQEIRCGHLGRAASFSFFPSKNLGAWGDGGLTVTNDAALATRLRLLRTHGGAKQYHHDEVGTNSRLDTLQAVVLHVKLGHLDEWNHARRANAAYYDEALASVSEVITPAVGQGCHHVYHQYTLRVAERDKLKEFLTAREIGSAVYYPVPLHLQPCFAHLGYSKGSFPHTEAASKDVLSIPVGPELQTEHREAVVEALREFYR